MNNDIFNYSILFDETSVIYNGTSLLINGTSVLIQDMNDAGFAAVIINGTKYISTEARDWIVIELAILFVSWNIIVSFLWLWLWLWLSKSMGARQHEERVSKRKESIVATKASPEGNKSAQCNVPKPTKTDIGSNAQDGEMDFFLKGWSKSRSYGTETRGNLSTTQAFQPNMIQAPDEQQMPCPNNYYNSAVGDYRAQLMQPEQKNRRNLMAAQDTNKESDSSVPSEDFFDEEVCKTPPTPAAQLELHPICSWHPHSRYVNQWSVGNFS